MLREDIEQGRGEAEKQVSGEEEKQGSGEVDT